ncbi:MAG: PAS domain S-box protein [Gammaproteobacteria bacterium]|nr:PAS domain S-box protein [Gammaproteobacteria bacterium]
MSLVSDATPQLILVVDDDEAARNLMRYVLPESVRMLFAEGGAEALELLRTGELPDLILLDRNMPEVDGEEVLRQVRTNPAWAHMAVIMVTADASEGAELEGLNLGADDYVTKPVRLNLLQLRVRNQLQRMQMRRELQEKERLARQIFNSAPSAMLVVDSDGLITQTNPRAEALFGYAPGQLLGQSVELLVPPEMRQAHAQSRGQFSQAPAFRVMGQGAELAGLKSDGSRFPLCIALSPFQTESGQCIIVSIEDQSERRAHEQAIRASGEKYRQLFMQMRQGAVYQDASGQVIDANPAACAILGLSLEEMRQRRSTDADWQVIHEDGTPFPGETHPAVVALETGSPVNDVLMGVFHPQLREYRWLLVSAQPVFAADGGKPTQVFVTFADISQRRLAEQAFRNEQRFNQAVMESSGGVLIVIDREGRIVRINPAVERLTGFTQEQLIGQPVWEWLIPPERVEAVKGVFRDLTELAVPNEYENEWLTASGERIPLHWYNGVILNDQGQATHIVAQGHDIRSIIAKQRTIEQDREHQRLLRALLEEGVSAASLEDSLLLCLERLVHVSWLSLEPRGGIFLLDEAEPEVLRLRAQYNFSLHLLKQCDRVDFGHCLCGRAAAQREMVYSSCVDARHDNRFPGMTDHGHYSIPLLLGERLLGVLVLYLPANFERNEGREEFLLAVANVLAGIIQRKHDERTLQKRELLYHGVVETSTDGFFLADAEGRLLETNAAYQRLSGYSGEELLQMRISELDAKETPEETRRHIEQILRQGSDLFTSLHRRKDGSLWPVEVSITLVPEDTHGRFFIFIRDISQREEMQQRLLRHQEELEQQVAERTAELERNRQELTMIFENLPAILYIKDLEGRYQLVNRRYELEIGRERTQILGKTDAQIFDPMLAQAFALSDKKVIDQRSAITVEEVVAGADGLPHSFLSTKMPLLGPDAQPYALLGVSIDVTPLKQLQQQLSRAEALAHLGSWSYEPSSGHLRCSDEARRIFGLSGDGPVTIEDLFARVEAEEQPRLQQNWAELLQGGAMDCECRIQVGDETRWLHWQAGVYLGEGEELLLVEGSVQDITPVKDYHQALMQALAETEQLARVRTEFLANMSHEIRTPLNGILGLAQIGQRDTRDPKTQRLFSQLYESGKLLLGIVNDILDFSKIEAGKLQINPEPMQLQQLVQHLALVAGGRASEKGFVLQIDLDPEAPPWIMGDPLRLSQVLGNLLSNAIKFTEQGKVSLSIRAQGDWLLFRVCDTGIGISPEHLHNLFQPFEQADGSITRRFGGTGLGLAITKSLVNMMDGEIEVESTLGQGSCFEVHLPLLPADAPASPDVLPGDPGQPAEGPLLKGLRILSAEDNMVNRMVLIDMLNLEGAEVVCVEDGLLALELIRREGAEHWDILLTDIHMPHMSGYELSQQLRSEAPDLPVVGVTAHAMQEEKQRCLDAGMCDHVAKPIVIGELLRVIRRHARPGWQARAVVKPEVEAAPLAELPTQAAGWPLAEFISQTEVLEQYAGRQAFIDKLLVALLESHEDTPAKLRQALEAGDLDQLAFVAHSFAGVAGAVRADAMRQLAKQVEGQARSREAGVAETTGQLIEQATRILAAIRVYLDGLG